MHKWNVGGEEVVCDAGGKEGRRRARKEKLSGTAGELWQRGGGERITRRREYHTSKAVEEANYYDAGEDSSLRHFYTFKLGIIQIGW